MKEIISGIYKISNLINDKFYIGSSKNIYRRWNKHITTLNNNTHNNPKIQNSWNKHGKINFKFEIIEIVDNNDLLIEREQYFFNTMNPFDGNGYNINNIAGGGYSILNNPNKELIKDKISKSMKKMWENKSVEDIDKYKNRFIGENNPSWKGGSSFAYCSCGKKISYVNKTCKDCLNFKNENNPFFGKKHTDEYKRKSSESRKGKYHGKQNKPILIDNIEYKSLGDAENNLDIKKGTIHYRVKSEKFPNYQFV